jgi:hypothetical protein
VFNQNSNFRFLGQVFQYCLLGLKVCLLRITSDGMPELVDASDDDGVVYPVTGESLVARRALNTHIKVDDAEQQR